MLRELQLYYQKPDTWDAHVVAHGPLRQLSKNIWEVKSKVPTIISSLPSKIRPFLTFGQLLLTCQVSAELKKGSDLQRNMVVYRLPPKRRNLDQKDLTSRHSQSPSGEQKEESKEELLLHSVIALSDEAMREIESLGRYYLAH